MLYSRTALEVIPFGKLSDTFHFDGGMLLVATKKDMRIKENPIPLRYAPEKSYLHPLKYGFEVFKTIVNYWKGRCNF